MESPFFVDLSSSGYLEDVIGGWRNQGTNFSHNYMWENEENWHDKVDNFLDFTSKETDSIDDWNFINPLKKLNKEQLTPSSSSLEKTNSGNFIIDQEHQQENDSPSSSPLQACMAFMHSIGTDASISNQIGTKKIAYPFDMTKRRGSEGYVTLEDINHHIFLPPTRPIKHPVGDFATHSRISTSGLSLSGRVVIAHARIHTQGSGSITVIRTKS